jgi:acetylornithine deacetylase
LALARAARAGAALGDVIMISAPSKRHARGVAAAMHQGLVADAALYLHPAESGAGLNEIKAFASGQLEFRITVTGQFPPTNEPGHTAFAHLAVNPVDKAVVILAALRDLDRARGERVHHPALHTEVGRSTNILVSNVTCGEDRKFGRLNEVCTLAGAISFPPARRWTR